MAHLPEDRREVVEDVLAELRWQVSPDIAGPDGHAPSLSPATATRSSSASRQSLVGTPRDAAGRRLVAGTGSIIRMPGRYSTRTKPAERAAPVTDTSGKRRPWSGCTGSVTSISSGSARSPSAPGVSLCVVVGGDRLAFPAADLETGRRGLRG
jgi:hypothetical protein